MGRGSRILLGLFAFNGLLVSYIITAGLPGPPKAMPVASGAATAYDASIGGCADACARARLDGNAAALRRRADVTRRATWACFGAGFGCPGHHLEDRTAVGPWEVLGLVDGLRTGVANEFGPVFRETRFSVQCGSVDLEWALTPSVTPGIRTVYPAAVLGYRWTRHEYVMVSDSSVTPRPRTPVATSWELERAVIAVAMMPGSLDVPPADARDLRRFLDSRLGLPAVPSFTDINGAFIGEPGVEAGPPCNATVRGVPPMITGARSLNQPGERQPRVLEPAAGTALMILVGCPGAHGSTVTLTVRAGNGAEQGHAEVRCTGELAVGAVFPVAEPTAVGPYTVDAQGSPDWVAYAYAVPIVHAQGT
ncbi:hypothetical protein [Hamadaea tsunoensis]|uniref:hypothetical protein n=1 Tax=Hamadaea tsunoensis TaxID=53368 RepID=UPI0003F95455|nr:hypothetical protein [Hamadaea tsunoensis]